MKENTLTITAKTILVGLMVALAVSGSLFAINSCSKKNPTAPTPAPSTTGTISITTNLDGATFTLTGPATYSGGGKLWTKTGAPAGNYTITFGAVVGYAPPPDSTKILVASGTIAFRGTYAPVTTGTITVATNLTNAAFTVTGPATYTGSGTSWTKTSATPGTYSISYGEVSGYTKPKDSMATLTAGNLISFAGMYAGVSTGRLSGKIYDALIETGFTAPIGSPQGATVKVLGTVLSATTAPDGSFAINGVPQGSYTIELSHPLYMTKTFPAVINPAQTTTISENMTTSESGEPNDGFASATSLSTGQEYSAYIRVGKDKDYYKVYLNASETLTVVIKQVPTNSYFRGYRPDQTTTWRSGTTVYSPGPYTFSTTAQSAGYYYFTLESSLTSSQFSNTNPYVFQANVGRPTSGKLSGKIYDALIETGFTAPIGSPQGATVKVLGTVLSATTAPDGSFAINGVPQGSYTIELSHPLYMTKTFPAVINPAQTTTISENMTTSESGEPNDGFASATSLSTGQEYSAYIRVGKDKDYYKVYLNASETLTVVIKQVPTNSYFRGYRPDQTTTWRSGTTVYSPGPYTFSTTAQSAGYYYFTLESSLTSSQFSNTNPYVVNVSVQ